MIKVSRTEIAKFNPCKGRFNNYIEHYGEREFTKRQFMGLKNITHKDKLWVAFRMMTQKQASNAAAEIARLVLSIYESKYPRDNRVRECVDAVGLYNDGKIGLEEFLRKRQAAYAAYAYAAAYAAYAAYADAAYADAACAAADACADAAYARSKCLSARAAHEKLQRTVVLKHWK